MSRDRKHRSTTTVYIEHWLADGGEMGALIAAKDWTTTGLGPMKQWPTVLVSTLGICLTARFPMAIYWGADRFLLYNDAWRPILGDKHPWGMGRAAQEVWPEIWDSIHPSFETVWTTGKATWHGDALLPMQRFGYTEECYFDYTFNPIRGESGHVNGILNVVQETTYRVLNDRRSRLLREIAFRSGSATSEQEACERVISAMATDATDIPFALLYLLDPDRHRARLIDATGLPDNSPARLSVVDLLADTEKGSWPFTAALQGGKPTTIGDLPERFGALPGGRWPEPTTQALALPIAVAGEDGIAAMLVAGVNPRCQLNEDYRHFFETVASHVAMAVTDAKAYSVEKRRAEALAELDRAKTAFFSNVSHEFRTPLALMLGPVEDLLAKSHTDLSPSAKGQLEVVNRNGLRLLRLVNTLLDFSRIEAGRVRAVFEPTNLAAFTAELASVFRSATERAGLRLIVDCPPLPEPVFVDRDMWEKIVLNLLSNAFKFTFEGEIEVILRRVGETAALEICDTGVGIPAEEMPRLFERFHRVQHMRSRTHEGSGIGLALVQELVKLHGGTVRAESRVGQGTTFLVTVPLGSGHLPPEQIGRSRSVTSTALGAGPFVEEALRWLPEEDLLEEELANELPVKAEPMSIPCPPGRHEHDVIRPLIVVVDDNADMRDYLARLLAERYRVRTAADGDAALAAVRAERPDLVLSDVMMPRLDGFGLLRELRADPATRTIPVILLSARAGEESRVEGLEHGADDYLIKPFSARELMARVAAHLDMARIRREAEAEIARSKVFFERIAAASPEMLFVYDLRQGRNVYMNPSIEEVLGYTVEEFQSLPPDLTDLLIHPDDLRAVRAWYARFETAAVGDMLEHEHRVRHADGSYRWLRARATVFERNGEGGVQSLIGVASDVTARKQADADIRRLLTDAQQREQELRDKQAQLVQAAKLASIGELASGVAHELNNPLNNIGLFIGNVADQLRDGAIDRGKALRQLETAGQQLTRAATIINHLRTFARTATAIQERVALHTVIRSAVSMIEEHLRVQGVDVSLDLDADEPYVCGSAIQLEQVMLNLLSNARDAMAAVSRKTVRIASAATASHVEVLVSDTGSGIPAELRTRIFDPFFTTKEVGKGTGLGLSISYGIIREHGGTISVAGGPEGATFIVTLPRLEERAEC